jgi:glutathione S-transferase
MIVLYQFPMSARHKVPNFSPFCTKIETYLRMVNLPYRTQPTLPSKAPKKKLPYIVDDGGATVADSVLIIDYLKKKYGDPLDEKLDAQQRALAQAVRCMLEEHLYFCVLYDRWVVDENFPKVRDAFFDSVPALLRKLIANMARKRIRKTAYRQGIGRHTREEVYAFGIADITAFTQLLGGKDYLLGGEASSADAFAYAIFANLLWGPLDSPLTRYTAAQPTLVAYCERIKKRFYA